jgi:serine/threonine-protein kinase HipA
MKCLFTYKELKKNEKFYSLEGLRQLNPKLTQLKKFPYTRDQQIREAQKLAGKISIQGIQPKLSALLSLKENEFKIVDKMGTYIIKPQTDLYPELPENEDLTMHLASLAGIQTPWHGLILSDGGARSYVVKRFDRYGHGQKLSQEDFAQLMGASRITKYEASMEQVAELLSYCTFPTLEGFKLFQRIIFSFLVGNEDMHLKNFSLQTDQKGKIQLTPAYDLVNSTIAMANPEEELALSLRKKKKGFKRHDFLLFSEEDLYIPFKKSEKEMNRILQLIPVWKKTISNSFLSESMKKAYASLLDKRAKRLVG